MTLRGEEDLAAHLLRDGLDRDFDLAFSNELRIDHSITCPIITLRPQADLPIVPIYTNIFAPPLPQPRRFVAARPGHPGDGRVLAQDKRVAIIGTGHLSLELGGPRQFGEHGPDPEFDRKAVEWIASGDIEGCLAEVTLDSLHLPGNATHGFMDFMLMMGVAGEGAKADHVETARPVPHDGGLLHLVPERGPGMSKYLLDKFLLHRRPRPRPRRALPRGPGRHRDLVGGGDGQQAAQLHRRREEHAGWRSPTTSAGRSREHDHVALFGMGAHPFLTLTLFIAMFERDHGPLEYQKAYGKAMEHLSLPYPDIAT